MSGTIKEVSSWLAIIGTPSIFALTSWCVAQCVMYTKRLKILMQAQQAQMRSQLLKDYYAYIDRGFIYEMELSDWVNQYNSYHALGKNGIMDARKDKILALPTKKDIK